MKRKLIIVILSVALTLTLIPTLAAYADELDPGETPGLIIEHLSESEDVPEVELEEGAGDVEEEALELELPKINLKSPVTQMSQADIESENNQYTLIARVGEEVIDPALVTWSSDNESVATISPEGIVTVIDVGKANFTAVMNDANIARDGYAKVFVFADKTKKAKKHK